MLQEDAEVKFCNAIKNSNLVFVVGTGVSIEASGEHPQASWKGLLKDGLKRVMSYGTRYKIKACCYLDMINKVQGTEDCIGPDDLIAAATCITDGLGGINSTEYKCWLRDTIGTIKPINRKILDALHSLRKHGHLLATTNYDDLLLDTDARLSPLTWKSPDDMLNVQRENAINNIIYLHGHWQTEQSVVLGRNSYNDLTWNLKYRNTFETFWKSKIWVYVGCGIDGLKDPDFDLLFEHHGKTARAANHWDFCLVKKLDRIGFNAEFEKRELNIKAISYGTEHSDLADYLSSLISSREELGRQPPLNPSYKSVLKDYAKTLRNRLAEHEFSSKHLTDATIDLPLKARLDDPSSAAATVEPDANEPNNGSPDLNKGISSKALRQDFEGMSKGAEAAGALSAHTEPPIRICKIREFIKPGKRTIVFGGPGCGKSTLLESVASYYALNYASDGEGGDTSCTDLQLPKKTWLPVLIKCRELDWSKSSIIDHYEALLLEHAAKLQFSQDAGPLLLKGFNDLLEKNQILLLVDGLDEIYSPQKRHSLAGLISGIAARYTNLPVIVTSRVEGFNAADAAVPLLPTFLKAHVDDLSHETKADFVKKYSHQQGWDCAREKRVIDFVCSDNTMGVLANRILFLSLIVQNSDVDLPNSKQEVFRNAVNWMIKRMRPRYENFVEEAELLPHLDFLAFEMERTEKHHISEKDAILKFKELRDLEQQQEGLRKRPEKELLDHCVDPIGILVSVGKTGRYNQKLLDFFHHNFREYFASCHLLYGGNKAVRAFMTPGEFKKRESSPPVSHKLIELGFPDSKQETFRQLVASLPEQEAGDLLQSLLPDTSTTPQEARAWSAFALKCLLEQAAMPEKVVMSVFDAAIKHFNEKDCSNSEDKTLMDLSLTAVRKSVFAGRFRERLAKEFGDVTGALRMRAGLAYLKIVVCDVADLDEAKIEATLNKCREGIQSNNAPMRVEAALFLTELFYLRGGKLAVLSTHHRDQILDMLMSGLSSDPGTIAASLWALVWFLGAAIRADSPERQRELVTLKPSQLERVKDLLCSDLWDEIFCPRAVLLLTRDARVSPVGAQFKWIYNLALVADGEIARRDLPGQPTQGQTDSLNWLLPFLGARYSQKTNICAAIALGSLSIFLPEMGEALWACFSDSTRPDDERDEALVYLAFIGDDFSRTMIERAADTVPTDKDDYLYTRGVFGLLLLDDADLLAKQISKSLPHSDLTAYAFCLAGRHDTRGLELLSQFETGSNPWIATAAKKALSMPQISNQLNHKMIENDDFKTMSLLSFVEKVKLRNSKLVMTYRARDENGRDFFAYIFCDREGVKRMKQNYRTGEKTAAREFGEILYADYKKDPDDKARAFLKKWLDENGGEKL